MSSVPQTYTISDFIDWHSRNQLILAPDFQRGSVWTPSAKVFLIDTILNNFPIPQVFIRTKIDGSTQGVIREVVDGQQRLRAILEFASEKLQLTANSPVHKGKRYSELNDDEKEIFLSYNVPVVQLINADDAEVLEVFARLNSYSVKLTPAELRHAEYSEPVKWAIYDAARRWNTLWNDLGVVSVRESVRLKHTSVIAEMFMALDKGYADGGERKINGYFRERKSKSESFFRPIRRRIDIVVEDLLRNLKDDYAATTFFDAPNFLTLFAAIALLRGWLPPGGAAENLKPLAGSGVDWQRAHEELAQIAQAFDGDDEGNGRYSTFVKATRSSTHSLSSRKQRLQTLVNAIGTDAHFMEVVSRRLVQ